MMLINANIVKLKITYAYHLLHIDNMLIFGTNLQVVIDTKSFLRSKFDMKDLGEVEVILRIKII